MEDSSKEQVDIAKRLLELARETLKVNREQSDEFSKQLAIIQQLREVIDGMKKSGFDDLKASVKELGEEQQKAAEEGKSFQKMFNELNDEVKEGAKNNAAFMDATKKLADELRDNSRLMSGASKKMKELGDSTSFVSGMWARFTNLLSFGGDILEGLGKAFVTIIEYTFKLGVALVNVAISAFKDFMEYAQSSAELGYALATAIEKVRQNFGDLGGNAAKAVTTAGKSMAGFAETGLSAFQVFGSRADQMNAMNEMAMALGGTFFKLTDEVEKSGGAMLGFQKGLGLSNEAMKGIASSAIVAGRSFKEEAREIEKYAIAVAGKSFKPISRAMGEALKDVAHFGGATKQQIAQAAQYAHTLGVELDKIVGTLDAFETFDSAADNAARLSQSFGVTVDAFKLMEAQSPDEILNNLREQFAKAGVDSASFNRQQLKMISNMTGLDAATAKQVFSLANQGESLDKIKQKGDAAAKTQLTQQEAMKKLADSIERLVIELPRFDGLFDAFFKGLVSGLFQTGKGQEALQDMMKTFQKIFQAGIDLGKFIAGIPAVRDFFTDIGTIILNLSKPFEIFSKNFKLLFEGKQGFAEFWTNMSDQIVAAFSTGESASAFNNVGEKLKGFAILMARGFGGFLNFALGGLGSFFTFVANWLSGKKGEELPKDSQKGAASEIYNGFMTELKDEKNLKKLDDGWNALVAAIKEKLSKIYKEELRPFIKEEIEKFFSWLGDKFSNGLKSVGTFILKSAGFAIGVTLLGGALSAFIGKAFTMAKVSMLTKTSELALNLAGRLKDVANKSGPIASKVLSAGSEGALKGAVNLSERAAAVSAGKVAAQAGATVAAKAGAKGILAKVGGKLIPGIGLAVGGYELMDAWKNRGTDSTLETVGKVISGASSIASVVPGVGTAISLGGMILGEGLKVLGASQKAGDQVKEAAEKAEESKDSIKSLTDAQTIDQMITAIKSAGRAGEITDTDVESFTKLMNTYEAVAAATGPLAGIDLGGMLTSIQNVMSTSVSIYDATKVIPDDFANVVGMKMFMLQTTFDSVEKTLSAVAKSSSTILSTGLTQNLENLGVIVREINAINSQLASIDVIDVVAKVGQIATSLGVGGKGEYKVKRGDVNLTVNFTVVMDVDKTEKVMIMRKDSIIRDRLNDAQSGHMSSEYEIPETYSPSTKLLISEIDKAKASKAAK